MLSAPLVPDGPEVVLSGRVESLTFVNGVYAQLAATAGDRPAYRLKYVEWGVYI